MRMEADVQLEKPLGATLETSTSGGVQMQEEDRGPGCGGGLPKLECMAT